MKMPQQSPDNSSVHLVVLGTYAPISHIQISEDAGFVGTQLIWLEENSSKAVIFRHLLIPPECQQLGVDISWIRQGVCPGHCEGGTCIFSDAECGQYLLTFSTKHTSHLSQCRFRARSLCAQQGTRSLSFRLNSNKKGPGLTAVCVWVRYYYWMEKSGFLFVYVTPHPHLILVCPSWKFLGSSLFTFTTQGLPWTKEWERGVLRSQGSRGCISQT